MGIETCFCCIRTMRPAMPVASLQSYQNLHCSHTQTLGILSHQVAGHACLKNVIAHMHV